MITMYSKFLCGYSYYVNIFIDFQEMLCVETHDEPVYNEFYFNTFAQHKNQTPQQKYLQITIHFANFGPRRDNSLYGSYQVPTLQLIRNTFKSQNTF